MQKNKALRNYHFHAIDVLFETQCLCSLPCFPLLKWANHRQIHVLSKQRWWSSSLGARTGSSHPLLSLFLFLRCLFSFPRHLFPFPRYSFLSPLQHASSPAGSVQHLSAGSSKLREQICEHDLSIQLGRGGRAAYSLTDKTSTPTFYCVWSRPFLIVLSVHSSFCLLLCSRVCDVLCCKGVWTGNRLGGFNEVGLGYIHGVTCNVCRVPEGEPPWEALLFTKRTDSSPRLDT